MKKHIPAIAIALLVVSFVIVSLDAQAQCAMCSFNAENSVKNGNTQGAGLNDGILFLLAMPFLALAGIGLLWYKKYRNPTVREIFPNQD